jgi:hypothetical protein
MQVRASFQSNQPPVTIDEVARRFNATAKGKGYMALCPVHDDHHPSLSIDPGAKQPVVVKCMSHDCDLQEILATVGLAPKDICNGNGRSRPEPDPEPIPAFDWTEAREGATDERLQKITDWRGYQPETLRSLRDRDLIGVLDRQIAFPVHDDIGWIIGAHVRGDDRWFYRPKGIKTAPLIFTKDTDSRFWVVAESQWDTIAFGELSGQWEIVCTRGAANGKLVKGLVPENSTVLLLTQNDPVGKDGLSPALKWEHDVVANLAPGCTASRIPIPPQCADMNDWLLNGATAQDLVEVCF